MGELSGKVAVVTGGSRGIGAAIVRTLSARGATVVVGYRARAEAADALVAELRSRGGEALAFAADLADPAAIESLFARASASFGRLDILVNNAGIAGARPLGEIHAGHVEEMFAINVRAPVIACAEATRRFGSSGGRIVNISSLNGRIVSPGASIYAASKAALESFTRSIAAELGWRGITVNAVAPGFTDTELLAASVPREMWPQVAAVTALGRVATPQDIADVVAFLVSDAARWITGQVIGADGGVRAW